MAERDPITRITEPDSAPFRMPRVFIPADINQDDSGRVVFSMKTTAGPIQIKSHGKEWHCRGTAAALVAGGFMRPEWCSGLPGNNKIRQTVLFDSIGPKLLLERRHARIKEAHITICRLSANTFIVEVPASLEQCNLVRDLCSAWDAKRKAIREVEQAAEYEKLEKEREISRLRNEAKDDVREDYVMAIALVERGLAYRLSEHRFRYSEEVIAQVYQHLAAAKQALLVGKILPESAQYQRDGNVVYLPVSTS